MTKRSVTTGWILFFIGIAVVLGYVGYAIIRAMQQSSDGTAIEIDEFLIFVSAPFVAIVAALVLVYPWFSLRSRGRLVALREAHPEAFLTHVVVRPQLRLQLKAIEKAFGVKNRARAGTYVTLVADAARLALHAGGSNPREVFAVPTDWLVTAVIAPTEAGLLPTPSLSLSLAKPGAEHAHPIVLVPLRYEGLFPRTVPAAEFPQLLVAMQAATHPAG